MISAKANALDEAIRRQDALVLRGTMERVPFQFLLRMKAVRDELVRDLAAEWRAAS